MGKKLKSNNFGFIQAYDNNTYEYILKSEKSVNINAKDMPNDFRNAFESFASSIIKKKGLDSEYRSFYETQNKKEDNISNRYKFLVNEKRILPASYDVTVKVYRRNNNRGDTTKGVYNFMREYGNSGSHPDNEINKPVTNFRNAILALKCFHKMARDYLLSEGVINESDCQEFDQHKLRIGDYHIETYRSPEDREETMCIMEYDAYHIDANEETNRYAIIHEYNQKDLKKEWYEREKDVYYSTEEQITDIVNRVPTIDSIYPKGGSGNERFYVAYNFIHKPSDIDEQLLKNLAYKKRLEICRRTVEYFDFLHTSDNKIYHRLFNYKCVKLCENKGNYLPYITKLNFAKLEKNAKTVRQYASNAKSKTQALKISKYIPGEWKSAEALGERINWEKVDVYSLGVFLADILMGEISDHKLKKEEMKGKIPEEILNMIVKMTGENAAGRPSCKEVLEVLKNG